VILAIDPGLAYIGIAMVTDTGEWAEQATIKLGGNMNPEDRIITIQAELEQILDDWPRPTIAVIEQFALYGFKGAITNAFQMGRVIQAILDILIPVGGVPARDVRRYITGNPNAKSAQIKEGLRAMGYERRSNEHERDALALALCWRDMGRQEKAV
jgi:Holliday junction resolvasome RuvABC endonuclease subunit